MTQRTRMGNTSNNRAAHRSCLAAAALAVFCAVRTAPAQVDTSDQLRIGGDVATNWVDGNERVLLIERNVSIQTDNATLTADRATLWLSNLPTDGAYTVQIVLAGNAKVVRGDVTREAGELFVTFQTRPDIRLETEQLVDDDKRTDIHYLAATQLRRRALAGDSSPVDAIDSTIPPAIASTQPTAEPTTEPSTRPARTARRMPVTFQGKRAQMTTTPDGKIALVLTGEVLLIQTRDNGDHVELQAENAVIYTHLTDAKALFDDNQLKTVDADRDLDAVYLEGDVRMEVTPPAPTGRRNEKVRPQQSLRATRIVYEFGSDRAILTDALLHTIDPRAEAPIVVRADAMRKLGTDEYEANRATISTSSFATPSLSLAASKVSIRQSETGNPRLGTRSSFMAHDVTPRLYGVPVFWFPRIWGTSTEGSGMPLRDIQLSNSTGFGFGVETKWGLFETLGLEPPENTDASYRLDYYSERGPAFGFDANYSGGYVSDTSLQPWGFNGALTGYITLDDGQDRLGKRRRRIPHDEELRGRFKWDHQHFLTDGWQLQARLGYISDGTFLEEWYRNEFRSGLPSETSLYLKRSQDTEVFTALVSIDTSHVASIADQLQEVYIEPNGERSPLVIEYLPEIGYHRLGDAFADDQFTFVSNNRVGGMHFSKSYQSLNELGFRNTPGNQRDEGFAGIPSYAYTGYTDDYVVRGDFRQEIAWPLGDDRIRATPFGVVRYTAYSDSPTDSAHDRLLAGIGLRASTQFYKVYNNVQSELFDINRMRHVVEPQVSLFASAQTTDRNELFIYDEDIDGVSDLAAAQFVLKQRFQTKRGAPGRQRSIDFLTLNTGAVFFANEPDEPVSFDSTNLIEGAEAFRGAYFNAMPEASLPRSSLFADAIWRITDTTALLADTSWNIENQTLATSAVGFAVQRDPRIRYFAGVRYIGEVNSTIGSLSLNYEISQRYALAINQSFDLNQGTNENTSLQLIRRFEQYVFTLNVYFDQIEEEGGITISVSPRGMPFGFKIGEGSGGRR